MAWRRWTSVAFLAAVAGCSAPEEGSPGPVLPADVRPLPLPPTPTGEPSDDAALMNWKSSVLDRADSDTLRLMRADIQARLKQLQVKDAELSFLPPGIALEERTRIARRIAYEKERLRLVEEKD
ncbi:MAG TPA: hypothetical protein VGK61_02380 [Planctomycetota bacterium]|jgi:hypothetical protein